MKYVLSDIAGAHYRLADGTWTESLDYAERFSHDAAKVRQAELASHGCHTKIVETTGRKRHLSESMVTRITSNLDKLERSWAGKTIGIGYEVDVEVGQIVLTLEPEGEPSLRLEVSVDISNISVGKGGRN